MLIILLSHYLFQEANSFPRAKLEENFELWRTDNVQGKISEDVFAPSGGYDVYYPLHILFATSASLQLGKITQF